MTRYAQPRCPRFVNPGMKPVLMVGCCALALLIAPMGFAAVGQQTTQPAQSQPETNPISAPATTDGQSAVLSQPATDAEREETEQRVMVEKKMEAARAQQEQVEVEKALIEKQREQVRNAAVYTRQVTTTSKAANPIAGQPTQAVPEDLINVDFSGGTAMQYIETIRKAAKNANIVVMNTNADAIRLPAITLRSVDVLTAIKILDGQTGQMPDRMVRINVSVVKNDHVFNPGSDVVIVVDTAESRRIGMSGPASTNVWSLADLIDANISSDSITTAVTTALGLAGDSQQNPAVIRFHKETSLLMAYGSPEQLNTIDMVIARLHDMAKFKNDQAMRPLKERLADAESKLQSAYRERKEVTDSLNAKLTGIESDRARLQGDNDAIARKIDQMSQQLAERNAMISGLQSQLDQTTTQLKTLEARLKLLQEQMDKGEATKPAGGGF